MNLVNRLNFFSQENYRMGGSFKWPPLSEVLEYRRQVRELVISIIETAPLELPITQDHPWVCLVRVSGGDTVLNFDPSFADGSFVCFKFKIK